MDDHPAEIHAAQACWTELLRRCGQGRQLIRSKVPSLHRRCLKDRQKRLPTRSCPAVFEKSGRVATSRVGHLSDTRLLPDDCPIPGGFINTMIRYVYTHRSGLEPARVVSTYRASYPSRQTKSAKRQRFELPMEDA